MAAGAIVAARHMRHMDKGHNYHQRAQPHHVHHSAASWTLADERRLQHIRKIAEHNSYVHQTIRRYDIDKKGKLNARDLRGLLRDMDHSEATHGTEPSYEEVEWVLHVADKSGDGCIDCTELDEAMDCWQTYVDQRLQMQRAMLLFDVDHNGRLDHDEILEYLASLNGGEHVSEEELQMILQAADVEGDGQLDLMELSRATALWYAYVQRKKKHACCTVQ
eukprot:TRINITY_DN10454_c0_g1_i1.p1 TRINITY_DN10454_c0_g1~~TRINITY_DN10454_c0_g1_i1.p1  ORF type:complete len:244 (-),score=42.49 TRINITY_DN10454_c0_g1_i1:1056-1715(-)